VASAVGSSNQLKVNWAEPDTNGDAIRNYYVTMSGGDGTTHTQTVPGTVRTANFTANNSESSYTFTVQAENKAGKGAVSQPSAPRRATGKLSPVSGVSATEANTGGAGQQVTINFRELTAEQRNGSAYHEVSYTYNASSASGTRSGAIEPGKTVGGFANGARWTFTVTANSAVAPSSDASAAASATPYGAPGTPSASGQNGGQNQKSLSFSWNSPSTSTNDVAYTQINIDGKGWERVAASGTRTVNTGGFDERHSIQVQTVNSVGTGGGIATAAAQSGPAKTSWDTTVPAAGYRTCTDMPASGQTSWDSATPGHRCDGKVSGFPWIYNPTNFSVNCWMWRTVPDARGPGQWYRINSAPDGRYVGRTIHVSNTTLGDPGAPGIPQC
jgi:hypothetical protein